MIININQPKTNEDNARIEKILKFEYPKIFKVRRSLLFLIFIINHKLEKKKIKGSN